MSADMSNVFVVPPRGISVTKQECTVTCDGFPVLVLKDPCDHITHTALAGHYMDINIGRTDGTRSCVVVDLNEVGIEDEAVVVVDLPAVHGVAIPPRKLAHAA